MKRNLELMRLLLLNAEKSFPGQPCENVDFDETDECVIGEHIRLLIEAGLVEGWLAFSFNSCGERYVSMGGIDRITYEGHEFLAAARNESIWNQSVSLAKDKVGDVSLAVIKVLLSKVAIQTLGI